MITRRQRQRMPNFTSTEENVLKMLAAKYHNDIEDKASNAQVWRLKNRAWERIAVEFYNNTQIERSAIKLKSKYETMKKNNKVPSVTVKREGTSRISKDSKTKTAADNSMELEAKDPIKKEIQGDQETAETDPSTSETDQVMSDAELNSNMSEADQVKSIADEELPIQSDLVKIQLPKVQFPKAPTEDDLQEMREFLQQYKNFSQGGLQIASATTVAQTLETERILETETIPTPTLEIERTSPQPCCEESVCSQNMHSNDFDMSRKTFAAQYNFYHNTEIRAQQKHLAELKNLEAQHRILEIELKIKQRQFDKSTCED